MKFSSYVLQLRLADGSTACRSFFTKLEVHSSANFIMLYFMLISGRLSTSTYN